MSPGSGLAVPGFRASGIHCGIKPRDPDLALIVSDVPAAVAGVFTRSSVVGAPVEWCRKLVPSGHARAVVINSGVSNVAMGARGRRDAEEMARCTARELGCKPREVFVASTGVIGEPLPMPRIRRGIQRAGRALSTDGLRAAAEAIRTTDTLAKFADLDFRVGGHRLRIAGIAKGSGMIQPDMATMLAFLVTDAAVAPPLLRRALRRAADRSFNRLTVDGETSTSDTLLLFANARVGNPLLRSERSPGFSHFQAALDAVAESLARQLARDGEGATRLVTVSVSGARSSAEADKAARRIANSLLVKTALFGGDPNWGRILQAVGAARVAIRLERARIQLGGVCVFQRGASAGPAARRRAARKLGAPEIAVAVHLGAGRARAQIWTCDLSTDYVRINAEYTT